MKENLSFLLVAAIVIVGVFVAFLPDHHGGLHRPLFAHTTIVVTSHRL